MMTAPVTLALTLMLVLALCLAEPNTCQPRAEHPFMPIYHIIGNVRTHHAAAALHGFGGRARGSSWAVGCANGRTGLLSSYVARSRAAGYN